MASAASSGTQPSTVDRVFIVRFWLEQGGTTGADSVWRGKVTNLNSERERYVSGVAQALEVIREAMKPLPAK